MALGRNLQLKSEEGVSIREKKEALRFINIAPSQLVEKEGSELKSLKVNLFTRGPDSRWDLLGSKEDFRMNCQYVLDTGYLGEELNVDTDTELPGDDGGHDIIYTRAI